MQICCSRNIQAIIIIKVEIGCVKVRVKVKKKQHLSEITKEC